METVSATDLAVAQDPARMQGVLQAALRPTTGAALDVRSCRIDYIRATPGRCVLQYQVELHEPASGAVSTQAVTGVLYGAERTQTVWTELALCDPVAQRPVGAYALPPAIYVPAHHLILQVVPYDNRLPGLRRAVEGAPAIAAAMLHDGAPERADL